MLKIFNGTGGFERLTVYDREILDQQSEALELGRSLTGMEFLRELYRTLEEVANLNKAFKDLKVAFANAVSTQPSSRKLRMILERISRRLKRED